MMIPGMTLAALVAWLITESLGAWMLSRWIAHGGLRGAGPQPRVPPQVVLGHAGLAFSGFICWLGFLLTGSPVPAWIALGLLAPAIGLGVSAVTIWTPYPVRQPPAKTGPGEPGVPRLPAGALPDELRAAMVDQLVAQMLAPRPKRRRTPGLAPLIPAAHGVMALATFLLATLAAIAAS